MILMLDPTRCDGYGKCVDLMPEMFTLDDWGYAAVEGDGRVPEGQDELARQTIAICPVSAILSGPNAGAQNATGGQV